VSQGNAHLLCSRARLAVQLGIARSPQSSAQRRPLGKPEPKEIVTGNLGFGEAPLPQVLKHRPAGLLAGGGASQGHNRFRGHCVKDAHGGRGPGPSQAPGE
jgi:hypothetical protein